MNTMKTAQWTTKGLPLVTYQPKADRQTQKSARTLKKAMSALHDEASEHRTSHDFAK